MTHSMQHTPDGTIEITMTIPWQEIRKAFDDVVEESVKNAEIPGFRKGKAPKAMVEGTLDKNKLYEETIRRLVPHAYQHAVDELKIRPVIVPDIQLKEATEGKDWVVSAKTCQRPDVTLKEYKEAIRALFAGKKSTLFVPGKEEAKPDAAKKPSLDEILTTLAAHVEAVIPDILLEHEVNNQLSQLVDQTKKLGLTVEQYLASTNRTAESIRQEYKEQARKNLTIEFALDRISENEGVTVTDEDIDKTIGGVKSPEERKALEAQRYYVASVIRRQKTLDILTPNIV